MLLLSVLVIAPLLFILYQAKYGRRNKLYSKIPSPKKKFLLHNALEMLNLSLKGIFEKFHSWHNDLGDVFHITLNAFDCGIVFIVDPKIAEAVSLHQPDRSRSILYRSLSRWIGDDGFFLSEEKRLKNRMKSINAVFNPKFHERVSTRALAWTLNKYLRF